MQRCHHLTLYPYSFTLHPSPFTLHPSPFHPTPLPPLYPTLHPTQPQPPTHPPPPTYTNRGDLRTPSCAGTTFFAAFGAAGSFASLTDFLTGFLTITLAVVLLEEADLALRDFDVCFLTGRGVCWVERREEGGKMPLLRRGLVRRGRGDIVVVCFVGVVVVVVCIIVYECVNAVKGCVASWMSFWNMGVFLFFLFRGVACLFN